MTSPALLFALTAALAGGAEIAPWTPALYPDRTPGPFASAVETYGFVLGEVCLPYIVDHRPIEEIVKARHLIAMPSSVIGASVHDRVWRVGPITTAVYAVAWADGTCTAFTEGGGVDALKSMGEAVIRRRTEGFTAGPREIITDGERARINYCETRRPHPYVVTVTTAEAGARRVRPISSTVFKSEADAPAYCGSANP